MYLRYRTLIGLQIFLSFSMISCSKSNEEDASQACEIKPFLDSEQDYCVYDTPYSSTNMIDPTNQPGFECKGILCLGSNLSLQSDLDEKLLITPGRWLSYQPSPASLSFEEFTFPEPTSANTADFIQIFREPESVDNAVILAGILYFDSEFQDIDSTNPQSISFIQDGDNLIVKILEASFTRDSDLYRSWIYQFNSNELISKESYLEACRVVGHNRCL